MNIEQNQGSNLEPEGSLAGTQTPSETPIDATVAAPGTEQVIEEEAPPPFDLSEWSTPAIPQSAWCATDFMVGVGMVIIQPKTQKIVVLYSMKFRYWLFPRGRKDVGESLEKAALREAHEESGYRVDFLPLIIPTQQPYSPEMRNNAGPFSTESIYMTTTNWRPGRSGPDDYGGVYLTSWFVGQIPENAVCEAGTRMPDEEHLVTYLLPYDEVRKRIWGSEIMVLEYVWAVYQSTLEAVRKDAEQQAERRRRHLNKILHRRVNRSL